MQRCNGETGNTLSVKTLDGLNPFDYLKDLFTRLPAAKITEIKQFTPAAWVRTEEKILREFRKLGDPQVKQAVRSLAKQGKLKTVNKGSKVLYQSGHASSPLEQ